MTDIIEQVVATIVVSERLHNALCTAASTAAIHGELDRLGAAIERTSERRRWSLSAHSERSIREALHVVENHERQLLLMSHNASTGQQTHPPTVYSYDMSGPPHGATTSSPGGGALWSHRTQGGLRVEIATSDITKEQTDFIVNSTDEHLQHNAGVAGAILQCGGRPLLHELQKHVDQHGEVRPGTFAVTSGGNLHCRIIHAVGPHRKSTSEQRCRVALYELLKTIIGYVDRHGASVALPLLSTGSAGVHVQTFADALWSAVTAFDSSSKPFANLRLLRIVDVDRGALEDVIAYISAQTGRSRGAAVTPQVVPELYSGQRAAATSQRAAEEQEDACPICLEAVGPRDQKLRCSHQLHARCLAEHEKRNGKRCPVCLTVYGTITGSQPRDGQMTSTVVKSDVPGHPNAKGAIVISYTFPRGQQGQEHPSPGKPYRGIARQAYLPNTKEGQAVLKLLEQAHRQRLIFTIGQSRTTGEEDAITWNDIHHKTSLTGGPSHYGYPDPTYLSRVRNELAAFGIV